MSGMHKGLFFQPEMLAEPVMKALPGKIALAGTGVGRVISTMPGDKGVGEQVTIPYFTALPDMEDASDDQAAATPTALTSSKELATVRRSFSAFTATQWAQWNGLGNVYQMAAGQIAGVIARRFDKAMIDAAIDPLPGNANVTDVSASAVDALLTHDNLLEARGKWGDETDDIAVLVVHSQTEKFLRKLRDDAGRPLLTDMKDGELARFNGIPIKVSDKMPVSGSTYTSLLCKRDALVVWTQGSPKFRQDQDALADADLAAVHVYWAAHRYVHLNGGTKPGVQIIKHLIA